MLKQNAKTYIIKQENSAFQKPFTSQMKAVHDAVHVFSSREEKLRRPNADAYAGAMGSSDTKTGDSTTTRIFHLSKKETSKYCTEIK